MRGVLVSMSSPSFGRDKRRYRLIKKSGVFSRAHVRNKVGTEVQVLITGSIEYINYRHEAINNNEQAVLILTSSWKFITFSLESFLEYSFSMKSSNNLLRLFILCHKNYFLCVKTNDNVQKVDTLRRFYVAKRIQLVLLDNSTCTWNGIASSRVSLR